MRSDGWLLLDLRALGGYGRRPLRGITIEPIPTGIVVAGVLVPPDGPEASAPAPRQHWMASTRAMWCWVALGALSLLAPTPIWWFGLALAVAGIAWAGPSSPMSRPRPSGRLGQWLPPLALLVLAFVMLPDVAFGDRPVSHDHTVHFFKAWQFQNEFLADGRLYGWSHRLFAGYPVNYLYPIGPDLWVSLFYSLGFGMISVAQAYSLAFFGCFALSGYAVFRFGERLLGCPWLGLLAGALYLTDGGAFRYGGWAYTVDYGVWPQTLSLSFALLALARLPAIFRERSWGPVAAFGVFMGLSLLCHPMPILLFPVAAVLALALRLGEAMHGGAGTEDEVGPGAALWRLGLGHLLGAVIAAAWLLPFASVKALADRYGVPWLSTHQIASQVLSGGLFNGTAPVFWVAGVAGSIMLFRSPEPRRRFVPWVLVALLAVGTSSIADELHLDALTDAVAHIQFSRISILMKPFLFLAVAMALVRAVSWLLNYGEPSTAVPARWRRAAAAGCVALVLGPVGASLGVDFYSRSIDRELDVLSERKDQADRDALVAYLNDQPTEGPLERVAFLSRFHEHRVIDLAARLTRPVYKTGFTPCSNFVYKMRAKSPSLLQHLSVRWVVAKKDQTDEAYEEVARFGDYRVYRFTRFDPNPLVVSGKGEVVLERFDSEEIIVQASADAAGYLRLPVSYFPRWTATRDGVPVEIEPWSHASDKKRTGFISAPLSPGRYVFRFERSTTDEVAPWLLLVGLVLALFLLLADRGWGGVNRGLNHVGQWLDDRMAWWPGAAPWFIGGTCAVVLVCGIGLGQWTPAMEYEGKHEVEVGDVRYDFLEQLHDAVVHVMEEPEPRPCSWRLDRFVCKPSQWFHVASRPERIEAYSFRRCISAHPHKEGPLQIRFPSVPVGDAIIGYVGVAESGKRGKGRPVDLLVDVGGERLLKKTTRREARRNWFHGEMPADLVGGDGHTEVVFTVEADDPRHRHLCFYAQMVDYP